MTLGLRTRTVIALVGLAASLTPGLATTPVFAQQDAARGAGRGGRGTGFVQSYDPRVQNRTYRLTDTGEDLPYCVFVSSKVSKERKNPLILAMMRREFNVDDARTYLMGHSMGGAGTYFLGSKHAKEWAAVAPIAPAAFLMNNTRTDVLQGIKDGGVPMFVTTGDADEAVPVTNTRMWVETMKEMSMNYEYKEYAGVTHGPIIEAAMPDIFEFFKKHTKAGRQ